MKKIIISLLSLCLIVTGCTQLSDNEVLLEAINNTINVDNYRSTMLITAADENETLLMKTTLNEEHDNNNEISKKLIDYYSTNAEHKIEEYNDFSNNEIVTTYRKVSINDGWTKEETPKQSYKEVIDILTIIKDSNSIKKNNDYYEVVINGEDIIDILNYAETREIYYIEKPIYDDYIIKVYIKDNFISKVEIKVLGENHSTDKIKIKGTYEFYDYNELNNVTIPDYATDSIE